MVIAFNIASTTEMITLVSTPMPDDVINYKFYGENTITDIRILWGFRPKLHIDWRIEIRHVWSSKPVKFQSSFPITWNQAFKIKRMVTQSLLCGAIFN